MLEQSIDTKTVEGKGNRHRMEFPEASAKADLPILIFPRMPCRNGPIPDRQRSFPYVPDLKAVQ
jgi:hypothetical protein